MSHPAPAAGELVQLVVEQFAGLQRAVAEQRYGDDLAEALARIRSEHELAITGLERITDMLRRIGRLAWLRMRKPTSSA